MSNWINTEEKRAAALKEKGQRVPNPKAFKNGKSIVQPKQERVLKALRITIDRAVAFGELAGRQKVLNKKTEQELADEAIDLLLDKYNRKERRP